MHSLFKPVAAGMVAAMIGLAGSGQAANYSFTGTLANPNEVLLFDFSVGTTSDVTLRTYSYAGGTNAAGTVIANGGFDPILSLFDSAGSMIDNNDDGDDDVPADPATGNQYDTYLFLPSLAAGSYTVSISAFSNFPAGNNLSYGFENDGTFNGRTASWAFDVLGVGEATLQNVPEPATAALFTVGLLGLGMVRRRRAA